MANPFAPPLPDRLPPGTSAAPPGEADVPDLAALATVAQRAVTGTGSVEPDAVAMDVVGVGSWTRRQVVVREDDGGSLVAWASVHDRAAGRTNVELTVAPGHPRADELAAALLDWAALVAVRVARGRGLGGTLLDVSVHADDAATQRWLTAASYAMTRTWLHMSRPVTAQDRPGRLPPMPPGVTVRRVRTHEGVPAAADLQTVHRMLEDSFADHFNSYRESFPEFLHRQREAPGHRWDHWWVAEVDIDGEVVPGGAVVSSVLRSGDSDAPGSYIDYIGVHRLARGRGVAKALLRTILGDAAERGRDRVDLEVDADSPTGADGLYRSMGWRITHRSQSWHRRVDVPGLDGPVPEARPL